MQKKSKPIAKIVYAALMLASIASFAQHQQNEPTSILIYKTRSGQSEEFANALLFTHRESFTVVDHFYPPNGQGHVIIERSSVVKATTLDDLATRNLVEPVDSDDVDKKLAELSEIWKRYEKARLLLKPTIELLVQYRQKLADGNVLVSGTWMTRKSYDDMIAAKEQALREKQMATERAIEERKAVAIRAVEQEKVLKEMARKNAEKALNQKTETFIAEAISLLTAPEAKFRSNLDAWKPLEASTIKKASELISQGNSLLTGVTDKENSVRGSIQNLTMLLSSSEAATAWQKGDGETAANKLIKLNIPPQDKENGYKYECWTSLQAIKQDLEQRLQESDKSLRAFYEATSKHRTVEAVQHLERALQFIPNPSMKAKLDELRKNSLGL